ncbi:hypothetical protein K504DRAFT_539350 [Pleomassaria siparia CBS 279.74]|uniref:Uncharacterized protein n=1 Tax=Pleomassaria siparia CBS 279.74 TaxID=1314801 RepID=A0A6G1JQ89_9PLEO|nr:hypothetical protein K504DRAFT_539350 [Pleomassaria siparia CBS 279.74]
MPQQGIATTGPNNPLHTFTPKEKEDLATAQRESDAAYAVYKSARDAYTKALDDKATSKEEVEKLKDEMWDEEEKARGKEDALKGLQDFCD